MSGFPLWGYNDKCPQCGGAVGPHSDMCVDCGFDTCDEGHFWLVVVGTVALALAWRLLA